MRGELLFLVGLLFLASVGVKGQSLFGPQKIISTDADGARVVYAEDLDGDGDLDVLSASGFIDRIEWYRNDGSGNFSSEIIISNKVDGVQSIYVVDLDGDSDMDVLSASRKDNKIAWYKNDGSGNFSPEIIISTNAKGAHSVYAADLDADGDMDVLSASDDDDKIAWYKNDGSGNFSSEIIVSTNINFSHLDSIYAADLDADGDMDIIASSDDKITWYENDGDGNFNTENVISTTDSPTRNVGAADLDGDGDLDVYLADDESFNATWYRNDGNGNFEEETMAYNPIGFFSYAVDLDRDDDMDILSAFYHDSRIAWYENDGDGNFSGNHTISLKTHYAQSTFAADLDGDGDMDVLSASQGDHKIAWYENLLGNRVKCFAFQDSNENGLYDNDEIPLPNQLFVLQPSVNPTFTKKEGYVYFFVENGVYQLTTEPTTLWELTTPSTYNITVTENSELSTYYFGFKPTRILPRVEPQISAPLTRCSRRVTYWLTCINTGTTIANGIVSLESDELMELYSMNLSPNNIDGQKITWSISDLPPGAEHKIKVKFQIPDFNSIGEILQTQATVQLFNDSQELVSSKTTNYNSEVLCSYDPNDKLARSNLLGQSEFAYLADTILYTIRFQNTGNDVAFNIRIEDTLDKKLDWTTFHPITASHDYRTELNRETGLATFYFDDIMLPDSTTNERESHGFVMFGIASLENLEDKTEVDNTASIFFDFNPPIITNTAVLTLIEQVETDIEVLENGASIRVFPNPFSDYTTIEVNGLSAKGDYRLEVMDILGRKLVEIEENRDGKFLLERGDLESGLYLIRVLTDENRVLGSGKILVE